MNVHYKREELFLCLQIAASQRAAIFPLSSVSPIVWMLYGCSQQATSWEAACIFSSRRGTIFHHLFQVGNP